MAGAFDTLHPNRHQLFASLEGLLCHGEIPSQDVQGVITDEFRLKSILLTLRHLRAQRAKIVLISHWGRPAGKPDPRFSLSHIVPVLRRVAPDFRTIFCPDVMGGKAMEAIS